MKHVLFFSVFSLFAFARCKAPERTFTERLRTSDALYWGDEIYHLDRSPLDGFAGFDTLFSDYPEKRPVTVSMPGYFDHPKKRPCGIQIDLPDTSRPKGYYAINDPFRRDKKYSVLWKIVGDSLYANEIYLYLFEDPRLDARSVYPDNSQYRTLERLTGGEFSETNPSARVEPEAPHGVMPAIWVSGNYFVKPAKTYDEKWFFLPVLRLTFDKGKLINVKKESFR
ncbi:hypothetical protein [uncultured Alistipes sp.]|uniref:hypothetical protein n=1 Tax=uncultured Alistipes sp. TaxID=538949 RepID=UPI002617473E|nr:hypothetical protein [uncultured Alistipes sp.]